MRRIFNLLMICVSISTLCACEDDKISGGMTAEEATPFVGVYKGKMTPEVDNVTTTQMWQQVKVTNEDGVLQMRMEAFRVNNIEFGTIVLDNMEAVQTDGQNMQFTAKTNQSLGNISNANILARGNISGRTMTVNFTIKSVSTPTVNATMVAEKRDRVENDTARILGMWFDDARIVMQPEVNEHSTSISFYVADTLSDTAKIILSPKFQLTPGSTISLAAGDSVDFTKGKATFTVWAEDSIHRTIYTVYSDKAQSLKYNLDEWKTAPQDESDADLTYFTPEESIWQTSNEGLRYLKQQGIYGMQAPYAVEKATDFVKSGNAAKIFTRYITGNTTIPYLQAGVFYTGDKFETNTTEPLKSIGFGTMFTTKPLKVRGWYHYTPGTRYYRNNVLDETGNDTCRISVVLYEVKDETETLDGLNIYDDEKIIALGVFESGATTASNGLVSFDIRLNYIKSYFYTKTYKMAIICTPSRDGASYEGADGSTLWVDDIEIISQDKK